MLIWIVPITIIAGFLWLVKKRLTKRTARSEIMNDEKNKRTAIKRVPDNLVPPHDEIGNALDSIISEASAFTEYNEQTNDAFELIRDKAEQILSMLFDCCKCDDGSCEWCVSCYDNIG